jgi:hypothetical protein
MSSTPSRSMAVTWGVSKEVRALIFRMAAENRGKLQTRHTGSRDRLERAAFEAADVRVCALLPRGSDTSGAREGHASGPASRDPYYSRKADLPLSSTRRVAPSLRSGGIERRFLPAEINIHCPSGPLCPHLVCWCGINSHQPQDQKACRKSRVYGSARSALVVRGRF